MLMTVSGIQLESIPVGVWQNLYEAWFLKVSQEVFDNIAVALSDERLQE